MRGMNEIEITVKFKIEPKINISFFDALKIRLLGKRFTNKLFNEIIKLMREQIKK